MKKWDIDTAHSNVFFSIKHMAILNFRGSFSHTHGTVMVDDNDTLASVTAEIDINSLATRNKERDEHLFKEDFFHLDRYPQMKFKSKKIVSLGGNKYDVLGDLTIKNKTKEVKLETTTSQVIKDPYGLHRMVIEASTEINRFDFDVKFDEKMDNGKVLLGDKVGIKIEMEVTHG